MVKYSTKYFGDFEARETDSEIIIDSKINLTGRTKDVSILMVNVNTYFHKINTCIKMLNKYP
jgi:tRNA threonylcarbamoyladenosine modification (KEOPS) complex  Pcc1 subunit